MPYIYSLAGRDDNFAITSNIRFMLYYFNFYLFFEIFISILISFSTNNIPQAINLCTVIHTKLLIYISRFVKIYISRLLQNVNNQNQQQLVVQYVYFYWFNLLLLIIDTIKINIRFSKKKCGCLKCLFLPNKTKLV